MFKRFQNNFVSNRVLFFSCILLLAISVVGCVNNTSITTISSIKSSSKIVRVLVATHTVDTILDPEGGIVTQNYFRSIVNKLKQDIEQSGISVDEYKFEPNVLSIYPDEELFNAIKTKEVGSIIRIDVISLSKFKGAIYGMNYKIGVQMLDVKSKKNLYEGTFYADQTVDLTTSNNMRTLADKIFTELKGPLGI